MAIRLEHEPIGIGGLAAFAAGRGRSRERRRQEIGSLYKDERRRRERIQSQNRSFSYQTALENMRQGAVLERDERMRGFALEDRQFNLEVDIAEDARDRARELEDAERRRGFALEDDAEMRRRDRRGERRQRERDETASLAEDYRAGRLEFPPAIQAKLDEFEKARAAAYTDRDLDDPVYDPNTFFSQGLGESRENILSQIEGDIQGLLGSGRPKRQETIKDYVEQNTYTDEEGTTYARKASGDVVVLKEGPAAEQRDRLKGVADKLMGESNEEGELKYKTYADALAEAQEREADLDRALGPRVSGRTQGVPEPPAGQSVSGEEFRARQFGGGYLGPAENIDPGFGQPAPPAGTGAGIVEQWRAAGTTPMQEAIRAAKAGDTAAQRALDKRGISWRQ